ncbi:hypothetical protein SGA02_24630 [Staphylococcus gallinarum]|uniref:Uncharacterized protein n=1 Tax=Staphylococcus gallinarum TaxID=1293 RepID=A0A380SBQ4_STAGA|nr:hypothetical protein SGA02_24630 [Staphylococcus gallinarum]SUQ38568.1 Uncharacterised protein [Staphylococcus gallinarum]
MKLFITSTNTDIGKMYATTFKTLQNKGAPDSEIFFMNLI